MQLSITTNNQPETIPASPKINLWVASVKYAQHPATGLKFSEWMKHCIFKKITSPGSFRSAIGQKHSQQTPRRINEENISSIQLAQATELGSFVAA